MKIVDFWPRASLSGLRKGFFLLVVVVVLGNLTFPFAILRLVISYFLISHYVISFVVSSYCCHFYDAISYCHFINCHSISCHVISCEFPIKYHHFLTCHFWLYHISSVISNLKLYFSPCYLLFLISRAAITARGQVTNVFRRYFCAKWRIPMLSKFLHHKKDALCSKTGRITACRNKI